MGYNYSKGRIYVRPDRKPRSKQPDKLNNWRSYLKRKFGITLEEYEIRRNLQNNLCAICSNPEPENRGRNLALDHCHKTGKLREFLCSNCNAGLGRFFDNPEILIKASRYIEKHSNMVESNSWQ